jgi:HAD superfamily hydrolase (TIGR01484 family)
MRKNRTAGATRPRPRPFAQADLSRLQVLFTDVDGTLNTGGVLESETVRALERLAQAGVPVVLVSGRPSGWGDCWIRTLPVAGAILENGGLYYVREGSSVRKVYLQSDEERRRLRPRLVRLAARALRQVPGSKLSRDSAFREVDLAIDYAEEARLGRDAVDRIEAAVHALGMRAVRSSVHVNFWLGDFDKLAAVRRYCHEELELKLQAADRRLAYVGDSYNDAPMFGGIRLSIGVANVRRVLADIEHPPAFITRREEGAGFREVARTILRERNRHARVRRLR